MSAKRGNPQSTPPPAPTLRPSVLLLMASFFERISPPIATLPCLSCLLGRINQSFCSRGFENESEERDG